MIYDFRFMIVGCGVELSGSGVGIRISDCRLSIADCGMRSNEFVILCWIPCYRTEVGTSRGQAGR
jgi:hypothetical protein